MPSVSSSCSGQKTYDPVDELCKDAKTIASRVSEIKNGQEYYRYTEAVDKMLTKISAYVQALSMADCMDKHDHDSIHSLLNTYECLLRCRKKAISQITTQVLKECPFSSGGSLGFKRVFHKIMESTTTTFNKLFTR